MNQGHILFLNGTSSSGKSTLANALLEKLPDYLIIRLDDVGELLWKMKREMRGKVPTVSTNTPLHIRPYLLHRIIRLTADYACNVIVDSVIDEPGVLDDIRECFHGYDISFVAVRCPLAELERRELERGDRTRGQAKKQFEYMHTGIEYSIEVDTFRQSKDECVQTIIASLGR